MTATSVPAPDHRPIWILPVIILSQFAGTSLWLAGNAVLPDLQNAWNLRPDAVGVVTSAVQFGFILGTLVFAFFTISDRYSPRFIFLVSSFFGALCNLSIVLFGHELSVLLFLRFLTGISLAGIYPVGMKIASGWYRKGLGNALGFLVGALVLGTAFPHLVRGLGHSLSWERVLLFVSCLSASGGVLMAMFVPNGPFLTTGMPFTVTALSSIFGRRDLRSAAFGYFGHMWELYAFYAFVPFMLTAYNGLNPHAALDVSFWSFCIIAAGSVGCAGGGIVSRRFGSARVAFTQLTGSGVLCLFSPFLFHARPEIFLALFILWGILVVGDSPQFSALVAECAPPGLVGSALTITNCIGFAITIVSIQLTGYLTTILRPENLLLPLCIGPLFGIVSLRKVLASSSVSP